MFTKKHCSVGILRPREVEASRYFKGFIHEHSDTGEDYSERALRERIEAAIENVCAMIAHVAKDLLLQISITEYQLHNPSSTLGVMGRKRAKNVLENEVLITVDPSPREHRFAAALGHVPLRRTIVVLTSKKVLMDMLRIFSAERTLVLDANNPTQFQSMNRVFPIFTPPNAGQAADAFEGSSRIVGKALLYPHTDTLPVDKHAFCSLQIPHPDDRECQPDFRKYLVEEDED
ncbi:hypothetical protein COU76_02180 [Candidatus Peregrinibacteria bacterium CG10_big_fil_rev_8_21_14_0_10_49_10]|nr:MAG: hypothetical protein COU76_02180 [Candidatus Peregrinibacteria bacterium CG10_big_fil_rev_8_21_14_0_10_49_10]